MVTFLRILAIVFIFVFFISAITYSAYKENISMYEKGYKDACIDFYQGKLKYNLIDNKDGSRTWQKIKGNM